ncbi:hypothetical protein CROQUDRAFT_556892 [Cronartium quercuum f. sp. fusiforme G11]|uniref:Uncharacterized protein n=1 Tax=Cronartium quercuum f. sp. fusiforme G11 TaxID=708437 RepID=A0A9P6NKC4_9BASI|nr:hypothetical protein CROQUDRAFT_556892 [Cronartium quercuum f. sp. fusiforme G11]
MSSNLHATHPLYAFLRPEPPSQPKNPISRLGRQGTSQSEAFEDGSSNPVVNSDGRLGKRTEVTKELVSILTTVRSNTAQLDHLASQLETVTQRLKTLESSIEHNQTDLFQLIGSRKSETEIIAQTTSDRVNSMFEPHLSGLKASLPALDIRLDALQSELVKRALTQPDQISNQMKLEYGIDRLRSSLESHIAASDRARSEDREKLAILEADFRTVHEAILTLSTLAPLLQSFLQSRLVRPSSLPANPAIDELQASAKPMSSLRSLVSETQGTDEIATLDKSQTEFTPALQSSLPETTSQPMDESSKSVPYLTGLPRSDIPNPHRSISEGDLEKASTDLPEDMLAGRVRTTCETSQGNPTSRLPTDEQMDDSIPTTSNVCLAPQQPTVAERCSENLGNNIQEDPILESNISKAPTNLPPRKILERYITRSRLASDPNSSHLNDNTELDETLVEKKVPSDIDDEARSCKVRKIHLTVVTGTVGREQAPLNPRRSASASVNRNRRQLLEAEDERMN